MHPNPIPRPPRPTSRSNPFPLPQLCRLVASQQPPGTNECLPCPLPAAATSRPFPLPAAMPTRGQPATTPAPMSACCGRAAQSLASSCCAMPRPSGATSCACCSWWTLGSSR
eukprot:68366-Chlamydomonas_euryale.AAC.1